MQRKMYAKRHVYGARVTKNASDRDSRTLDRVERDPAYQRQVARRNPRAGQLPRKGR